jgi:hypothetical protein
VVFIKKTAKKGYIDGIVAGIKMKHLMIYQFLTPKNDSEAYNSFVDELQRAEDIRYDAPKTFVQDLK